MSLLRQGLHIWTQYCRWGLTSRVEGQNSHNCEGQHQYSKIMLQIAFKEVPKTYLRMYQWCNYFAEIFGKTKKINNQKKPQNTAKQTK